MNNENEKNVETETENPEPTTHDRPKKKKKQKYSGAYWYLQQADEDLTRLSFTRALLSIIAFMLQLVAVFMLTETESGFLLKNYPSYAYSYTFLFFITPVVAIYTIVINFTRNKLIKRIPVERAPKNGFKFFAYVPEELFVALLLVMFVMKLSFVCMAFDGLGLVGMFLALASLGTQIWSRTIAVKVLRTAERIPAEEK